MANPIADALTRVAEIDKRHNRWVLNGEAGALEHGGSSAQDCATLLTIAKPLLEYMEKTGHHTGCARHGFEVFPEMWPESVIATPEYRPELKCTCGYDQALAAIQELEP